MKTKTKKSKKFIIRFVLLLLLIGAGVGGFYYYQNVYVAQREYFLVDVMQKETLLEVIEVNQLSTIQIFDERNVLADEISIDKDTRTIPLSANDTDTKIFSYWSIAKKDNNYDFTPVYEEKKDLVLSFQSSQHTQFAVNDTSLDTVNKAYTKGDDIYQLLPKVTVETGYGYRWYYQQGNKSMVLPKEGDETINPLFEEDTTLELKEFKDENQNGKDDSKEVFTITYQTNAKTTVKDKTVNYGDPLNLPSISETNKIMIDWYSDEKFKEKVTEETIVTSDMTVYAKLVDMITFINQSVENPITRKDLALQVEDYLANNNTALDNSYNHQLEEKLKAEEELKIYNKQNGITSDTKETQYAFHNRNQNKLYVVTFLDKESDFKFAIVVPYGQTVKVFSANNQQQKEYSIRQNTTIVLSNKNYLSEYYQINNSVYVKITEQ